MRLPNEAQLSKEQKEVCFAPTDSTTLVMGPPGSGKTVIAIYRQNTLKKRKKRAQTLVFNHVLKGYTGTKSTFYSWLSEWWMECTRCRFPGAVINGSWRYDFEKASEQARGEKKGKLAAKGNWGHIIIDEAQDFDKHAHQFLFIVREVVFSELSDHEKPSMTILADENQRLNDNNSTAEEIVGAHFLDKKNIYHLRSNYRNTRQIARLSAKFYVGLSTGIPSEPTREGDRPRLIITNDLDDAVSRIVTYSKLHQNQDIGVLVKYQTTRKKLFNKLSYRLKDTGMTVQTYTSDSNDEKNNDATKLVFDGGGSVTVLCFASAKGLEFDTVFLPELQTVPVSDESLVDTKMAIYVMSSRARDNLYMMVSDPLGTNPIWRLLPTDDDLVIVERSEHS